MRLNDLGSYVTSAALVTGKFALHLMRIGATRTAIHTLTDYERDQSTQARKQLKTGYDERVKPELEKQIRKFNVIKGGK